MNGYLHDSSEPTHHYEGNPTMSQPSPNGRLNTFLIIGFTVLIGLIGVIYTNLSNSIARSDARIETMNTTLAGRGERIAILEGKTIRTEEILQRMATEHQDMMKLLRR
jgi:hypothetical protein